MSTSDSENSEDEKQGIYSIDIIRSNKILGKLYEIGYNGRKITKNFASRLIIEEATKSLKKYAANYSLPMKAYGPLILGLVRVYNKKLLLILEDAMNIFKQRIQNQNINISKIEKKKKDKFKDEFKSSDKPTNIKWLSNSSSDNMITLMNESIHHMIDNMDSKSKDSNKIVTPSKKSFFGINSHDILQRTFQKSALSQKISNNISSNINNKENNFANMINFDNNILNNSKNNKLDFNDDINYDINENINDNELNYDNNEFVDLFDIINQNKKSVKEIEQNLKEKEKKNIFVHKNKFLDFDDNININLEPSEKKGTYNVDNMINQFKEKLFDNYFDEKKIISFEGENQYEYLIPDNLIKLNTVNQDEKTEEKIKIENDIFSNSKNDLSTINKKDDDIQIRHDITPIITTEKKRISISSFKNESKQLLKSLSRLSLNKNDFNGTLLTSKINEINEKEEENEQPLLNDINNDDTYLNNNINDKDNSRLDNTINDKSRNISIKDINEEEIEKINIKELCNVLNKNILNKKKSTDFYTIFECVDKEKFPPAKLFYDLLILAQNNEIEITQSELFNNSTIKITK